MACRWWLSAALFAVGFHVGLWALRLSVVRALLRRLSPAPGSGPSRETLNAGSLRFCVTGESAPAAEGQAPSRVTARLMTAQDAGYLMTARWLAECGAPRLILH